jgi:hypothetical protein
MSFDIRDVLKRTARDPEKRMDVGSVVERGRSLRRQRTFFVMGAAALVAVLGVASVAVLDRPAPRSLPPTGPPSPSESASVISPEKDLDQEVLITGDGWGVSVSVEPKEVGQLEISLGDLHLAPANDAHPWLQHELVVTNNGESKITFEDTRTSVFLPGKSHPMLLLADEGCGYGIPEPGAPVEAGACHNNLDAPTLAPGETLKREITLTSGLEGMDPLEAGAYVFERRLEFTDAESRLDVDPEMHVLRITYEFVPVDLCETQDTNSPNCEDGPKPEPTVTTEEFRSEPLGDGRYRVWPRSEDVANEGTYRFSAPHCGLSWMVDFDASFWDALRPHDSDGRDYAFFHNSDQGTITFEGDDGAVYIASTGEQISLRRLRGPIEMTPCA